MSLSEGVKFWNSRRIWCSTKPFFSHVVYVIPVVEVGNKLFNFMVMTMGDARGLYFGHGHENGSRLF